MKELILIVVGAALVNNIILSQFQGLQPEWVLLSYSLLPWPAL